MTHRGWRRITDPDDAQECPACMNIGTRRMAGHDDRASAWTLYQCVSFRSGEPPMITPGCWSYWVRVYDDGVATRSVTDEQARLLVQMHGRPLPEAFRFAGIERWWEEL